MAGAISMNLNKDDPMKSMQGYDAAQSQMGDDDSVESNIARIISSGSPLMQAGETAANREHNKRGTLKSSMHTGAIFSNLVDRAAPIAEVDTGRRLQNKQFNTTNANDAYRFNADSFNKGASQLSGEKNALDQITTQGSESRQTIGAQGAIDANLITARGDQDVRSIKEQGTQQQQTARVQGEVETGLIQERGRIDLQLQTADAATREKLLNRQAEIDTSLQTLRGQQNIEGIKTQGAVESQLIKERGEIDKQLQTADLASRAALLERQGQIDTQLQEIRGKQSIEAINRQGQVETGIQTLRGQQNIEAIGAQADENARLQAEQADYDTLLQKLRGDQAERLSSIEQQSANLRQASQSAAQFFSFTSASMSEIMKEPEMTEAAKQTQINKQTELLENGLTVIGAAANLDLSGLLVFNTAGGAGSTNAQTGTTNGSGEYNAYGAVDPNTGLPYATNGAATNATGNSTGAAGTTAADTRTAAQTTNSNTVNGVYSGGQTATGAGATGANTAPSAQVQLQSEVKQIQQAFASSDKTPADFDRRNMDYYYMAKSRGMNTQQFSELTGIPQANADAWLKSKELTL